MQIKTAVKFDQETFDRLKRSIKNMSLADRERKINPGAGTNAFLISLPLSSLTGMFCRFGLLELSLPVSVAVWLKEVCTLPVKGFTRRGKAST